MVAWSWKAKECEMRILVTAASRHGSTLEIAERIAENLRESVRAGDPAGLTRTDVVFAPVDDTGPVGRYDAAIIGSALYLGRWLRPARRFVETNVQALSAMPTWIFTSGPVGEQPRPAKLIGDATKMENLIGTHGHQVFPGRLVRKDLNPLERAFVAAVRAPEGDFRDWALVDTWSAEITRALTRAARP
jgi:menaquinone-dependent protoporphyrinogen oxidase